MKPKPKPKPKPAKQHEKSAEVQLRKLLDALVELHEKQGQKGSGELRWQAVNAADELAHALSESAQVPCVRSDEAQVGAGVESSYWVDLVYWIGK